MLITQTSAIITGGASGLGEATARHFRAMGAKVTILDRDAARGQSIARDIGAAFAAVDVTDEASVQAGVNHAKAEMGGLNVVVNCAGIVTGQRILGKSGVHSLDGFSKTIGINLIGTFNVLRLAAQAMEMNEPDADGARGVIINTASIAAMEGQVGQAAYSASKAGVAGMTLPIARDLARQGIRVMAIAPGIFMTPMLESLGDEALAELSAKVTFPKRPGRPQEFAHLAQTIVECGYLNGETIRIDGALRLT